MSTRVGIAHSMFRNCISTNTFFLSFVKAFLGVFILLFYSRGHQVACLKNRRSAMFLLCYALSNYPLLSAHTIYFDTHSFISTPFSSSKAHRTIPTSLTVSVTTPRGHTQLFSTSFKHTLIHRCSPLTDQSLHSASPNMGVG